MYSTNSNTDSGQFNKQSSYSPNTTQPVYNQALSVEIFDELMNGRMINREILGSNGKFEPNPQYKEIMDNLSLYKQQYKMSGYTLVANANLDEGFIYIIKGEAYEISKTELAMKAYCLLLLIGKYLTSNNLTMSKIIDEQGGLTTSDFSKMQTMENIAEILENANMQDDLLKNVKSILVDRHIMYKKVGDELGQDRYILSNAGKAFYDELVEQVEVV